MPGTAGPQPGRPASQTHSAQVTGGGVDPFTGTTAASSQLPCRCAPLCGIAVSQSRHTMMACHRAYIVFDSAPKPEALLGKLQELHSTLPASGTMDTALLSSLVQWCVCWCRAPPCFMHHAARCRTRRSCRRNSSSCCPRCCRGHPATSFLHWTCAACWHWVLPPPRLRNLPVGGRAVRSMPTAALRHTAPSMSHVVDAVRHVHKGLITPFSQRDRWQQRHRTRLQLQLTSRRCACWQTATSTRH